MALPAPAKFVAGLEDHCAILCRQHCRQRQGTTLFQRSDYVTVRRIALFVLWSLLPLAGARGEAPRATLVEIEYLLQHVGTSGCEFYRNGSWYDAVRAESHLRDKYKYLDARHQINSAEDFIDRAATKSSLS